jgi:hypothetical protein
LGACTRRRAIENKKGNKSKKVYGDVGGFIFYTEGLQEFFFLLFRVAEIAWGGMTTLSEKSLSPIGTVTIRQNRIRGYRKSGKKEAIGMAGTIGK